MLDVEALPFFYEQPNQIFQKDNVRCHVSERAINWFDGNGVVLLPWPAKSPDMSPIEYMWDIIGQRLKSLYQHSPSSLDQLYQRLEEQWELIPFNVVTNLIASMSHRVHLFPYSQMQMCQHFLYELFYAEFESEVRFFLSLKKPQTFFILKF